MNMDYIGPGARNLVYTFLKNEDLGRISMTSRGNRQRVLKTIPERIRREYGISFGSLEEGKPFWLRELSMPRSNDELIARVSAFFAQARPRENALFSAEVSIDLSAGTYGSTPRPSPAQLVITYRGNRSRSPEEKCNRREDVRTRYTMLDTNIVYPHPDPDWQGSELTMQVDGYGFRGSIHMREPYRAGSIVFHMMVSPAAQEYPTLHSPFVKELVRVLALEHQRLEGRACNRAKTICSTFAAIGIVVLAVALSAISHIARLR